MIIFNCIFSGSGPSVGLSLSLSTLGYSLVDIFSELFTVVICLGWELFKDRDSFA